MFPVERRWLKGHSIYLWTGEGLFYKFRAPKKRKKSRRLMKMRVGR